jgi:Ulp1 family protease
MTLIERMVLLANRNGHPLHVITENWIAQPVSVHVRQTNSHDCGVWVLACIAAVLRGYHVTGLTEDDMVSVRKYIADFVCSLPLLRPSSDSRGIS